MKKIILLAIAVIMLTGCGLNTNNRSFLQENGDSYYILIDKDTCVEYIGGMYKLSVRLNADGIPMLDEECLNGK